MLPLHVRLEKQHRLDVQLSERLASFGIMGAELMDPLKPLRLSEHYRTEVFKGVLNFPHYAERRSSLEQRM